MRLVINGEDHDSNSGTVRELLKELGIETERVAVEVNMTVVKKSDYESLRLSEGDEVEIVNFVGGG